MAIVYISDALGIKTRRKRRSPGTDRLDSIRNILMRGNNVYYKALEVIGD